MSEQYHLPVMLKECIDAMEIDPKGNYVDVTFGGGGHSKEILKGIEGGKLFSFDQDEDAAKNVDMIDHDGFQFVPANFRHLVRYLKMYKVNGKVDAILADLGISSHQIDEPSRGFSTRFDARLDMRMDQSQEFSAWEVINEYEEKELHKILGMYGEIRNAKTVARAIVSARSTTEINTIEELKTLLKNFAPRGKENRFYAQVFQAIRIEVNEELKVLEEFLEQTAEALRPGGRLVVMSYHSLEDRLVKNFIAKGKFHGAVEKDLYGNDIRPLDPVTRKPIVADEEELQRNPRARSAKLRVAVKR
ncbi:16S rRNA (cytosine(1402)-N(4))-methyltransferase RsmH [Persicobacter psychrovividus]|uniref:Ribosomal RNA small subunit methyltransferase H n=1 Tax=Persicobacter psychrovividus TaxID=387638 RepID=A0ABM7VEQ6_9BACT|nr:ribosomal RNA small subunit methyltransferase H [Persicobacter psychrovividus]